MKPLPRWLLTTLAGTVAIFVWGGLSHLVLLKGAGFRTLSNEERIVSTLRASLPGDGVYFLPNIDLGGKPTAEEQAAWEARFRAGPTGLIVYQAAGDAPVSPQKLSVQFLSAVLAAGIVSYVLSLANASYWRRVALVALVGAFGWISISTIYWNWYGFPNAFFVAQGVDMIVGWALAGTVIARLIPPRRT